MKTIFLSPCLNINLLYYHCHCKLSPISPFDSVNSHAFSWFASTHPDGLEWSIEKITGKGKLAGQVSGIAPILKEIQEKTAFLPDYNFKQGVKEEFKEEKPSAWPGIEAGTSVAGIVGGTIVLMFILLIGFGIRLFKKQ